MNGNDAESYIYINNALIRYHYPNIGDVDELSDDKWSLLCAEMEYVFKFLGIREEKK